MFVYSNHVFQAPRRLAHVATALPQSIVKSGIISIHMCTFVRSCANDARAWLSAHQPSLEPRMAALTHHLWPNAQAALD